MTWLLGFTRSKSVQSSSGEHRGEDRGENSEGRAGLTAEIEAMQSLVEHPGAVGVLAGLQGSGYGPGAFQANLVACHGEGEAGHSANASSLKREEKKRTQNCRKSTRAAQEYLP